ncbi:MAG: nucleotidyltransferase domain-containing protein [Desulfuromonadaceae bacterium]|nr:nucleotidyltransferase domain-containing protein [Desulfuromonadaceae bacterium]
MDPLPAQLINSMVETLRLAVPDCIAIYRFGSFGTDDQRLDSDIDLALLPESPLDSLRRWEIAQQLANLARKNVDLVDLWQASTVLRMQVVATGERLYCANRDAAGRFEDHVFSSYARLNEERQLIIDDARQRGSVYGK